MGGAELATLGLYSDAANEDGESWYGVPTVAKVLGRSEASVKRANKRLVDWGYIDRSRRRASSTVTRVVWDSSDPTSRDSSDLNCSEGSSEPATGSAQIRNVSDMSCSDSSDLTSRDSSDLSYSEPPESPPPTGSAQIRNVSDLSRRSKPDLRTRENQSQGEEDPTPPLARFLAVVHAADLGGLVEPWVYSWRTWPERSRLFDPSVEKATEGQIQAWCRWIVAKSHEPWFGEKKALEELHKRVNRPAKPGGVYVVDEAGGGQGDEGMFA